MLRATPRLCWSAALVLIACMPVAHARVRPLSSAELVGAELIVIGTIAEVQEETITVDVSEHVVGACDKRIQVARFKDWTCAGRWTKYRAGQKILFFLDKRSGQSDEDAWRILGTADEGEVPIVDDMAYPPLLKDRPFGPRVNKSYDVYGGRQYFRTPCGLLTTALRDVRKCFAFSHDRFGFPAGIRRTVDEAELDAIRQKSELHRAFIDDIVRFAPRLEQRWRNSVDKAQALIKAKNYQDAEVSLVEALEFAEVLTPADPRFLETLEVQLDLFRKTKRDAEAKELEARVRQLKES